MSEPVYVDGGAVFSKDRYGPDGRGMYRYYLWRSWDASLPFLAGLLLNPSTADERKLDPTLRKFLGFAKLFGCGGFGILNMYALRSTDPKGLWKVTDPVGPDNDDQILKIAKHADIFVVGFGKHATKGRVYDVTKMLKANGVKMRCLAKNGDGSPQHPLYIPYESAPGIPRELVSWP